ncbi:alpha/beta fold hydrolase [Alcanivorax sp. S6407]|uniref:alpha/beta fold hydrolase n=1 Tax=Alcanivorax sp. S6407 TaxID=2926424 RepID=UPI001FF5E587|nr:alpha/beta fold hydrolase [Alcanivorax sp. S6407]MCK0153835.1 alpha/beta fold hydrolase [Alcanivorax sp. S6407]
MTKPYRWMSALLLVLSGWLLMSMQPARAQMLPALTGGQSDCVVVLHGLRRSAWAMSRIEDTLTDVGYQVYNQDYPSTSAPVETLAQQEISQALDWCRARAVEQIHFVTHSMGGILVRSYLQERDIPELGRVVMLAPPNQGSEVVDRVGDWWLFRKLTGPAGQQLGTGPDGIAASLEPVTAEIGVIAGTRTVDPWLSWMIPGDDDGKVSLPSTRLKEMRDYLVVPASHAFIMRKKAVIKQVLTFLQHGYFAGHEEGSA